MTQSDMSLTQGRRQFNALTGPFGRLCVDESQIFRRLQTKKLDALKKTDARFRRCASVTICHDTLKDIRATLSFLERPELSAAYDRNAFASGEQGGEPDAAYLEALAEWRGTRAS